MLGFCEVLLGLTEGMGQDVCPFYLVSRLLAVSGFVQRLEEVCAVGQDSGQDLICSDERSETFCGLWWRTRCQGGNLVWVRFDISTFPNPS